ncbi:RsmB/NOP family class I SAM-dependent RNA methyltransferase [Saccharospirillum impatiens]|uniref:RsmB/NOP family class I SAM-dependent RNA methyltransferase n=1 Tax=Saccharospirillum impatiens TaxID=169438 RepID=UPI000402B11B|nr:RsmB/NOP family class I SAM-dependent RNA methyltransferase [Saccharospirillum impatiens]
MVHTDISNRPQWPGYRWPHLCDLTRALQAEPHWPQMDRWLAARFRERKAYGGKDRRFYSDRLFQLCRLAAAPVILQQGYAAATNNAAPDNEAWTAETLWQAFKVIPALELWGWLVLLDGADDQAPRELTDIAARREWLDRQYDQPDVQAAKYGWLRSWNPWFERRLAASQWPTEQAQHWQAMQMTRPPIWLRALPGKGEQAARSLHAAGLTLVEQGGDGLALEPDSQVTRTKAWDAGWVEIQDRASQRIVDAVAAAPGHRVWDVCAGGGGKAVALASRVGPSGEVVATDIRAHALQETERRAARQGFANLRTRALDVTRPDAVAELNAGTFDRVVIDAPCSGAGTWRRNPDSRWRLTGDAIQALQPIQDQLLTQASVSVKTGGYLVYATCSWLVEENEDRVSQFLSAHPGFTLLSQAMVGAPEDDADTMFVAVMQSH